ncbi:hypothetical protein DFH08DRAFT_1049818 [Mycena albidolilacea]|uniref:Uncharacterized protein n=1 Tax=Mycena albidolilacea TaxID=1033008 RepID=A0AAD7EBC4_9AGAR|nr:hypothetical protein DFH08DRAFT_1049818 [Mycena albidolilacea]
MILSALPQRMLLVCYLVDLGLPFVRSFPFPFNSNTGCLFHGIPSLPPDDDPLFAARGCALFENSGDDGWRDRDDDDAAADADAISLHSHLGLRDRRRAPPRTPKHISLWGFNVFGRTRGVALEGGDDALHARPHPPASGDAAAAGKRTKRRGARSTLKDVSAADVARRARSGSTASQGHADTPWKQTTSAVRAARRARRCVGSQPRSRRRRIPDRVRGIPLEWGAPTGAAQRHTRAVLATVRPARTLWRSCRRQTTKTQQAPPYSPVGEIAYVGMPRPKKSKSKRTTKSKSSATSSTLASPSPTTPFFPHGVRDSPLRDSGVEFGAEDEFDGTPGGFDSNFGVEAEAEPEVLRGALPSPGLSRGAGGFRFGSGGGKGISGF